MKTQVVCIAILLLTISNASIAAKVSLKKIKMTTVHKHLAPPAHFELLGLVPLSEPESDTSEPKPQPKPKPQPQPQPDQIHFIWTLDLGVLEKTPNGDEAAIFAFLESLLKKGRKFYLIVDENGRIKIRENFERAKGTADITITGVTPRVTPKQISVIQALYNHLTARPALKKYTIVMDFSAISKAKDPNQWLIDLRDLIKKGKSGIIDIDAQGAIKVREDKNAGSSKQQITWIINILSATTSAKNSQKLVIDFLNQQKDLAKYNYDETKFSTSASWYIELLKYIKAKKPVDLEVDELGKIIIRPGKQTNGGKFTWSIVNILSKIKDKDSVQYQTLLKLIAFIKTNKPISSTFTTVTTTTTTTTEEVPTPITNSQITGLKPFIDKLESLLKAGNEAFIKVDGKGTILMSVDPVRKGGKSFYRIIRDSPKPTVAQSSIIAVIEAAIKERKGLSAYLNTKLSQLPPGKIVKTTSTTTVTTTTVKDGKKTTTSKTTKH